MNNQDQEGTLKKSIRGGKWVFINTISQRIITFSSFIVLARLLVPEDFGIVAILVIVPDLLTLIADPTFNTALIQKKGDPKPYLNSMWTFRILRGVTIFVVIFFSAPIIANFFHLEKAIWAFRLSGLFVLVGSFSNVATIYFFKELDFKKIFIRDMAGAIGYSITAVTLAIFYHSFWPLFFGMVAMRLSSVVSTYVLHSFRPRLNFKFKKLLNLVQYSKWIYGQNLIGRAVPMIENSLLGKLVGATGVGLYTRAKSLASMPSAPIYNIIDRVTFPAYAQIQDSYEKIRAGFIKSLEILFFMTIPMAALFIESGHRIILVVLGEKWIEITPLLKILVLAATANVLTVLAGPIFNAIGKPKIQFKIKIVGAVILAITLFLLIPDYGTMGAAIATLVTSTIIATISLLKTIKILSMKIFDVIKLSLAPIISSIILLVLGKFILWQTIHISHFSFTVLIVFLGALYFVLIALFEILLKTGPYKTLKLIFYEVIGNKNK